MARNHCENALTCYKDAHGEWWCDCYLLGNAQAVGLQCGKGVCELYNAERQNENKKGKKATWKQ